MVCVRESTNRKSATERKTPGEATRYQLTHPLHTPQLCHVPPVQIKLAVPAVSTITQHGTDSPYDIPEKKFKQYISLSFLSKSCV